MTPCEWKNLNALLAVLLSGLGIADVSYQYFCRITGSNGGRRTLANVVGVLALICTLFRQPSSCSCDESGGGVQGGLLSWPWAFYAVVAFATFWGLLARAIASLDPAGGPSNRMTRLSGSRGKRISIM